MQDLGQLLLIVAFFMTLTTALTAIVGAVTRDERLMRGARSGLYATTLVCLAMAVILTHGFVTHAFDNKYVATYSDRGMPLIYLLASFWGGEKGALLFWVTSLAIFSSVAIYTKRERSPVYLSWVVGILSLAILFFFVLMVFESSPFETFMTSRGPNDGRGLNPLLQNPVMAFHPPALLTGYILFTIPFAFGMAALITKKLDDQWIADTRRWTIVSWVFLTIGLLLGARWAYMEIGWGFWWMWDSVENAGFIPWFTATAFLHSVMIQERRGMLKRWNMILLATTFMLTIFGTFLTRSQLIVSIHSFADSVLPNYFLSYLAIIFAVSAVLIGWRWRALKSEARIESMLSRESAFVLNNVILVFASVVLTWGTLMGKITESPTVRSALGLEEPQVWDEAKFNEIFVPIGIALLLLMAIGPLISWRRATAKNFRKNIAWPLALGAITTLVVGTIAVLLKINSLASIYSVDFGRAYQIWVSRYDAGDVLSVVVYFLCAVTLFGIAREFHLGAMVRRAKQAGGYLVQMIALTVKNPRRYGGYLVHVGVVFLFIAFTGKAFQTEEKDRLVTLGNVHSVGDYSLALVDRDRFWNDEESCVSTAATFIVMPLGSTVAAREVDKLAGWMTARGVGVFHVETVPDSPFMRVRFKDPAARRALLADAWLARGLADSFTLIDANDGTLTLRFAFTDTRLAQSMPFAAMESVRDARLELTEAGDLFGATAEITPGLAELGVHFQDAAHYQAFRERYGRVAFGELLRKTLRPRGEDAEALTRRYRVEGGDVAGVAARAETALGVSGLAATVGLDEETLVLRFEDRAGYDAFPGAIHAVAIPTHIRALVDDPERGAVDVVDMATGAPLHPELRSYPRQGATTTEVAISNADFLIDVYVSMQPSEDPAYIKVFTVIFPLVNFLWIGGMLLMFGAAICLIPPWLGKTIISIVGAARPKAVAKAAALLLLAGGLGAVTLVGGAGVARAIDLPEATGFAPPAGDPVADVLAVLDCACEPDKPMTDRPSLADPACACPKADNDRIVVRELVGREPVGDRESGKAKYTVLGELTEVDPAWELRFRYDEAKYEYLKNTTLNTCSGEVGMSLGQSKATCHVRSKWLPRFRRLLAAGVSTDAIYRYYVADNNVTEDPSVPWTLHDLRASEDRAASYGVPIVAVSFALLLLVGIAVWSRRRRAARGLAPPEEREQRGGAAPAMSRQERDLLADELDTYEY